MPANLDWRTEEDERRPQVAWDEPVELHSGKPARRPPWRFIIVVVILLATVGGIMWWRINRQIAQTLQVLRAEIVADYNLMQRAASEGDEELFRSLLLESDPAWSAAEMKLFQEDLLFDRRPLGLISEEGPSSGFLRIDGTAIDADRQQANIEFSADLSRATVTANRPYRVEGGDDSAVLQQTVVLQRDGSRWALAPPTADFWGESKRVEGERLSVTYPARDAAIAGRLAADLDASIGRLCAMPDMFDCPTDLRVALRFDTDPASLASLPQLLGTLPTSRDQKDLLILPTPTLVGLPVNDDPLQQEASYASLRDGYARHIISAIIARSVGWHCCYNALLFNALLEYQLGQLGLKEWPINPADHQRVLESRIRLSDMNPYLPANMPDLPAEEQLWEWRAAVDFLANGVPGTSVVGMERLLSQMPSFDQFLEVIASGAQTNSNGYLPDNLDALWWLYAFNDRAMISTELTRPPTGEDLLLACRTIEDNQMTDRSDLYHYSFDNNSWEQLYGLPGFIWMTTMADPGAALIQEISTSDKVWRTRIWRDNDLKTVYTAPSGVFSLSFGETDHTGSKLITYNFNFDPNSVSSMVVDLDSCNGSGCRAVESPGRPVWSPDGQSAIYVSGDNVASAVSFIAANHSSFSTDLSGMETAALALGPGDAQIGSTGLKSLVYGRAPFWVDDETYGFIRRIEIGGPVSAGGEEVVVLGRIGESSPTRIISLADLRSSLPASVQANRLAIGNAITHPSLPHQLFLSVFDIDQGHTYAFSYDLDTRKPELIIDTPTVPHHGLGFSPDGRYLLMTGQYQTKFGTSGETAVLLVHDLTGRQTFPFIIRPPFYLPSVISDWTEDGRFLAMILGGNHIAVVDMEKRDVQLLSHDFGSCASVVWVKP